MNLLNFGKEQMQKGMLNNMLEQVGIDDVGAFVDEFRQEANHEAEIAASHHQMDDEEDEDTSLRHASNQQANVMSMGRSFLNQVFFETRLFRWNHVSAVCLVWWKRWRW